MKLEKIWIVIGLILVIGLLSTSFVKRLVTTSVTDVYDRSMENQEFARLNKVDRLLEDKSGREARQERGQGTGAGGEAETWQNQLERQLDVLEQELDEEEVQALFERQMEWTLECEEQNEKNASRLSSGELTQTEYSALQAQAIRARCYELAAEYPEILGEVKQ